MREWLYGRNAVYETLRAHRRELFGLQVAEGANPTGRLADILERAKALRIPVSSVPRARLDRLNTNHQGVALDAADYPYSDVVDILEQAAARSELPFVLLIDSLQDPQNFGTLLRTAEIVGVHGVVIPLARTVDVTPAVVNASSGASEHLLIARSNLSQAIDTLRGEDIWVVGLDQDGEPMAQSSERQLHGSIGLVVGSEGEGLHELTKKKCDILLRLPMRGQIESLNAAVAGSVALYLAFMARSQ